MTLKRLLMASAVAMVLSAPAFAQTASPDGNLNAGTETQRDVNQQDRIDNGLKDGDLSTGEAAHLEKGEQRIDNTEAKDMKNGTLTPEEKAHIQAMQNHESKTIAHDDNNNIHGNPNSASSERMQHDVSRDANQEQRIHNGVASGQLTNHEAGHLEHGQARDDHAQARAGKDGHMSAREQRRMQRQENRKSGQIYGKKHNSVHRRKHEEPAAAGGAPAGNH